MEHLQKIISPNGTNTYSKKEVAGGVEEPINKGYYKAKYWSV